jgi:alkanesulfonate monooxygenase SsuD/methylene tetrahydromethanopterin reductase-like flavin-dependent oxidoreductase (luciferase family)
MVGGGAKAAYRRAAQYGAGWTMGGGTPDQFREGKAATEEAWREHGREGSPRTSVLAYFSLGANGPENAREYLHDYYAAMGEEIAEMIAQSVATDEDTVAGNAQAFDDLGADELVWFPCSHDLEQVELLAEAVADRLG